MSRKRSPLIEPPSVPAYIVTFSDMITLLLTFFVLLISMAQEENKAKFQAIQEAFNNRLSFFGIRGVLDSLEGNNSFSCQWSNNPIQEQIQEQSSTPTNAKEEQLRRLFGQINKKMQTRPSQIKGKLADMIIPDCKFESDSITLNNTAINSLSEICSELKISLESQNAAIYVVALSQGKKSSKQWFIAAQRAQSVADFINQKLQNKHSIYSWGTADPSEWITSTKANSIESDIIISIIK